MYCNKFLYLLLTLCFSCTSIFAQGTSINSSGADPDASAILDVSSTSQGVLLPRMTAAQKTAISSPATGLLVFQTDGTVGIYMYNGTQWKILSTQSTIAVLTTTTVSSITSSTASSGGNIGDDGGSTITARGVCWSTSQSPTISDSKTTDGAGTGTFTSSITGLTFSTTYYVRAYATNGIGTSYGDQVSFTTSTLSVGDSFGGGVVFYVNGSTIIISATTDQSTGGNWGGDQYIFANATGTAIGTGESNTALVVASHGVGTYPAKICSDLSLNGYDDWYLPSKDELDLMIDNRTAINLTLDKRYWTSTDTDDSRAYSGGYVADFFGGGFSKQLGIQAKVSSSEYVRAIRTHD